jgi:hypothetical protein
MDYMEFYILEDTTLLNHCCEDLKSYNTLKDNHETKGYMDSIMTTAHQ